MKEIGKAITDMLEEKGMTRAGLADRLGYIPCRIDKYIHGKNQPQIGTAIKIAEAFGVSLYELVGSEVDKDSLNYAITVIENNVEQLTRKQKLRIIEALLQTAEESEQK